MSSITSTQPQGQTTNPQTASPGPQAPAQAAGGLSPIAGPIVAAQAAASSAAVTAVMGPVSLPLAEATPQQDSVAVVPQDPKDFSAEEMFRVAMVKKLNKVLILLEGLPGEAALAEAEEASAEAASAEAFEGLGTPNIMRAIKQMTNRLSATQKSMAAINETLEDIANLEKHYHLLKKLVGTNVTEDNIGQLLREEDFLREFDVVSTSNKKNVPKGKKSGSTSRGGKSKTIGKNFVSGGDGGGGGGGGGGAAKTSAQERQPQIEPDFNGFVNQVFNGAEKLDQKVTIHQRVRRWYKSGLTPQQVQSWSGYEGVTIEKIEEQMSMHTFPGLARVFTNYTIIKEFVSRPESDSPFIIAGFQATPESDFLFGKIQFGIDKKKGLIYHMQFVELEDLELQKFVDGGQIRPPAAKKGKKSSVQKKENDGEVFTYVGAIETQASENGENAILLRFPNNTNAPHLLKLFSLR